MRYPLKSCGRLRLVSLTSILLLSGLGAQAQNTLTNGLVAYWNFDQKNFKDSVGTFDGTENGNTPIAFVESKAGFGQAIKLDGPADSGGADQFVEITGRDPATYDPDQLGFEGGSVSISAWFTVTSFDKSWQALIAKGESSNWRVARNSASSAMSYAGGLTDALGATAVDDGNWHNIVAISDAEGTAFGTAIYVDGLLDGTIEGQAGLAVNGKNVMIGENPDARNRYWHGLIDDVAIWNRVLTEAEVKAIYNNGTGKPILAPAAADTDKDGMPDDWEKQYGLNPNDPTDAAKDCNNNGVTNLDEYKAGLDPCDATPPAVVSVSGNSTFDAAKITFSENLDLTTATNLANYTITPNLPISAVTYKSKVVTLTTSTQAVGGTYTIAIKGLKDLSKNQVPAGTTATLKSFVMGKTNVLKFSYWGDATGGDPITGTSVDDLLADARYPASPDLVRSVYSFNSRDAFPDDTHDNYGATMEGFLTPKESGSYRFFVYSDDASRLFLSTDDKEANLALIAEETACCNNFTEPGATHDEMPRTSDPIALVAGKSYFIRMIYKEGTGGDFGQVAWRKEGDTTAAAKLKPIPAEFLSSAVDLPVPPAGSSSSGGSTLTINRSGNSITIGWSPAGGTLESSPTLGSGAVWTSAGTANPATVTIGTANAFYRIRQ